MIKKITSTDDFNKYRVELLLSVNDFLKSFKQEIRIKVSDVFNKKILKEFGDNHFCLLIDIDNEESLKINGFCVLSIDDFDVFAVKSCLVWAIYVKPYIPSKVFDEFLLKAEEFAKENDCTAIKMESYRNPKVFSKKVKKFGYIPFRYIQYFEKQLEA